MEPVVIGGLRLVPVTDGTLEHDLHYMRLYTKAGLGDLTQGEAEAPEEFAKRILGALLAGGVVLEMLGTLFVPEDVDPAAWTPEMAQRTAKVLGAMRDAEAKKQIEAYIAGVVIDFFERGLVSFWKSSARSSRGEGQPAPTNTNEAAA
jgi:hypothetical protein